MGKKLTPYQQFVKSNYNKYGGDFKKIAAAWRAKKTGKSSSGSTRSTRKNTRSSSTSTRKVSAPRKRPRGKKERKVDDVKKEFEDLRRALGYKVKQCHFKIVKQHWSLKIGPFKATSKSLSTAMKNLRKRCPI